MKMFPAVSWIRYAVLFTLLVILVLVICRDQARQKAEVARWRAFERYVECMKLGDMQTVAAILKKYPLFVNRPVTVGDYTEIPINYAITRRNRELVKLLIAHGADVNGPPDGYYCGDKGPMVGTPLEHAAKDGQRDIVLLLVAEGADLKRSGGSALCEAALQGHCEIVELLLERGVDTESTGRDRRTPLYIACECGNLKEASLLLSKGAKLDGKGPAGATPLHAASCNGHKEVVRLLVAKGANVKAIDDKGLTPLDRAKNDEIRTLLSRPRAGGAKARSL